MKKTSIIALFLLFGAIGSYAQQQISIAGQWRFAIDRDDRGVVEKWYLQKPSETITLPGSMSSNFKGDNITLKTPWTGQIVDSSWFKKDEYAKYRTADNLKIPAWLQPVKYYKGAAWYIKEIEITPQMAGKSLEIELERVHSESSLWVDGEYIGTQNSLGTPHRYILKPLNTGEHTVAIMVDNRIKDVNMGYNAHSVSDHTQSNWNGIVGDMNLRTLDNVTISNVALYPNIDKAEVAVVILVENRSKADKTVDLNLEAISKFTPSQHNPSKLTKKVVAPQGVSRHEITYPMGDNFYKWDEFTSYFYTMHTAVDGTKGRDYDFGMRKFESRGKSFYINDRPIFLRGTLECAIFPKTGYPAMDEAQWARIFNICKAHGLNHVRFHSWCPPRAAFKAADRLGVYLQVEGGGWCVVGNGGEFDRWIYAESDRIFAEYGNHPSFVLYTYGNEPDGPNQAKFLGELVDYFKTKDSRHLYTSAAGWPMVEQNQYRNDMYPRLKVWGADSPFNIARPRYDYQFDDMIAKCKVPWVSHEIGQWCVYPDLREIDMYSDAVLQAKNFEIFRETLSENGLADYALDFMMNSGKLQTLLYKTEIEAALRTKDFAGFQLLDLHDFPGQGTALVGVLNPFWESKGYVSSDEYHSFSSAIVPLVRIDRVIFRNNETLVIPIEIANFGAAPLAQTTPSWQLKGESGRIVASGNLPKQNIAIGNNIKLGTVSQQLSMLDQAEQLTLVVDVAGNSNSWDFWVYPAQNKANLGDVKIVDKVDPQTISYLKSGGKVLLSPSRGGITAELGGNVKSGFSTIFWNSAWTAGKQPPLTLGLLNNVEHPALSDFPTETHSNFQWYEFVTNANIVNLTALNLNTKPIVRVIDDWFQNRSLALIFEVKVGNGKLLYCGSDLTKSEFAEVEQLKKSLLDYMNSDKFAPQDMLSSEQLLKITN